MFGKNRKRNVGLCAMVVMGCFILAGIWTVLATPETALAKKPDKTAYSVEAVARVKDDYGKFVPSDAPLHSTCPGVTGNTMFYVEWPRFDDCIVITPTPAGEDSYELTDDPQLIASMKRGEMIHSVRFFIQDQEGPDGIQYSSDPIPVDPPVKRSSAGFTLHLHVDGVQVWRHKNHTGGPRVEMVGWISVGDIVFTPR